MRLARSGTALVGAVVLGLAPGCTRDDGATVRTDPSSNPAGSGHASGSATGSGSGSAALACKPVGDVNSSDARVVVKLREWSVAPQQPSVPAGSVTFHAENDGAEAHELVVIRLAAGADPGALPTAADGSVDESRLEPGALVGEVERFAPGETCDGTWDVTPGAYALLCNVVEQHDGVPVIHYRQGMHARFTVT